jgi:nucleotide-binding universal stress UspA family protein
VRAPILRLNDGDKPAVMKNILVPIDYSEATQYVINFVRELAKALQAEVHLVHVKETAAPADAGAMGYGVFGVPDMVSVSGGPATGLETIARVRPAGETREHELTDWQKELGDSGLKATLREPTGPVVEQILREADARNADLIVMGTHGHGAMYNLLVGSVTEGVLKHSIRPVLLVPTARS